MYQGWGGGGVGSCRGGGGSYRDAVGWGRVGWVMKGWVGHVGGGGVVGVRCHAGVGWVMLAWGWVMQGWGLVIQGWGGVAYVGGGWHGGGVMQGWGWGGVGYERVRWIMKWWGGSYRGEVGCE